MLEEIAHDQLSRVAASNQPMFSTAVDFDAIVKKREGLLDKWRQMDSTQRAAYQNQEDFEVKEGVPNLKDQSLIPARNLSLMLAEIREKISQGNGLERIGIESLDFDDSLLELAESLENGDEIKAIYRLRKRTVGSNRKAGINSNEAAKMKNCFSQGRELFLAGKHGSLMVKPLNFFYALTAYSYGVIVLNNPLRFRKDMIPGSHGMGYLPATIQAQFGGDSPRGTFSDLVGAFPCHPVKTASIDFNVDCSASLISFYDTRFDVSLGTLLSMVPEMSEYYKLTTGRNSRCYPIDVVNANDPRSLTWEFHIGNGDTRPSPISIEEAFKDFTRVERFGKYVVTVPASKASTMKACIYTDVRGQIWFVENPFFPVILPEVAIHFLITNIFSSIMRYRPDEWGSVLLNDVSSEISLLTRHYFSSFQRKFLLLVLRSISRYIPYAT